MHLKRVQFTTISVIGELWLDDLMECYTLEDCVRKVKIPHVTAIPAGRYEVIVNLSKRFGRLMPLLLNVPNFEGVRIHSGNTDKDTDGCILVGRTRGVDFIGESVSAFSDFMPELQRALARDKVWIRITDEYPVAT